MSTQKLTMLMSSGRCGTRLSASAAALAFFLFLGGCATGPGGGSIYVPMGGGDRTPEQEAPSQGSATQRNEPVEQPRQPAQQPQPESRPQPAPPPSHRTESQAISPAAAGLIEQADAAFRAGNLNGGLALLQRAQRISPDASAIYYKMAEGYVLQDNLARAEQFAMKGISVAGANQRLQKSGWQLLSDIRSAQGNVAGARSAEERASAL